MAGLLQMTLQATVTAPAIFVCFLTSAARSHHLGGHGGHVKPPPVVRAVPGNVTSLVALLALFPV